MVRPHSLALALTLGLTHLVLTSCGGGTTPSRRPVDLDVLIVGAHPDDEIFDLAAYGQWNEDQGTKVGVVTLTRGEGGGNAVGPEEGPALGLIREGEERRATALGGIRDLFYLDKVDFYYTVSAPLSEQVWGHDDTLEKLVRTYRMTRPEVILTLNPSPSPGNHGHHQVAARLALEAFVAAADPTRFASQLSEEGLSVWRARKILLSPETLVAPGWLGPLGPGCATAFSPQEPTDEYFGAWAGRASARAGKRWTEVQLDAERTYASQGWAGFPDLPGDERIGCNMYLLADSRVPYTSGNTESTSVLEGALEPARGGLEQGTEFFLTMESFRTVAGQPLTVTAHVRNAGPGLWSQARIQLTAPSGWQVSAPGALSGVEPGQEQTVTLSVTPPATALPGRVALDAVLSVGGAQGHTREVVELVPEVVGTLQPLASVQQFREWTVTAGFPQLDNLLTDRASLGLGETRSLGVNLHNFSARTQSGTVTLTLPPGFSSPQTQLAYESLAPGETRQVSFQVSNSDSSLPTSNQGGDYPLGLVTTSLAGSGTRRGALNLVPTATLERSPVAPTVDGLEGTGEYTGPVLDVGRVWEGEAPSSAADASARARVAWTDDALYVLVDVKDDVLGTVLPRADAKRHWRTDSVEIALDPHGDSENTSTTFKVGLFPTTKEGGPAAYRDADFHQGPIEQTARGMQIASHVTSPYTGYTIEAKIPFDVLPTGWVDAQHLALNLFVYDSDTQDLNGQTRLGWSTWGGVQGDPYRWGHLSLPGYVGGSSSLFGPTIPLDATSSLDSPLLLLQSVNDHVPPGGQPEATFRERPSLSSAPTLSQDGVSVTLATPVAGLAHVMVWTGERVVAEQQLSLDAGSRQVTLAIEDSLQGAVADHGTLLVGWRTSSGHTAALSAAVGR